MYKICDNIIINDIKGEIVITKKNDHLGNIIIFNNTGKWILLNISNYKSENEMIKELAILTNESEDDIIDDVKTFIEKLVASEIIEKSEN